MSKRHLKRYAAPKSWTLLKKERVFITRPNPGAHKAKISTALNLLLKQLGFAETTNEVKKILNTREIFVDGKRVKDHKFPVGLMDVVSIKDTGENFRILLNEKGKLKIIPIEDKEAKIKLCKIINKTVIKKGKVQINFNDARNIIVEKDDFKTGDTVIMQVPEQKIIDCLRLDKKMTVLITDGKHIGTIGSVEDIKGDTITYSVNKEHLKTLKKLAFVVGKDKEAIKLK